MNQTQKEKISIHSYEHPDNLKLMIDLQLVSGAQSMVDVFMVWSKLTDDKELRQRQFAYTAAHVVETKGQVVGPKFIIDRMTRQKKVALRDRILGVVEMRGGKNV